MKNTMQSYDLFLYLQIFCQEKSVQRTLFNIS